MKKTKEQIKKQIRNFSETSYNSILSDLRNRNKAIRRSATESSLEYKIEFAAKKCVQNIHPVESEWKKLRSAKIKDEFKIEQARESILLAMDKAAADSAGRLIAEIKQLSSINENNELINVDIPVKIFYKDFKNFCEKELETYSINEKTFEHIVNKYLKINLISLKSYGEKFGYTKPAEYFEQSIKVIKILTVKEKVLSL